MSAGGQEGEFTGLPVWGVGWGAEQGNVCDVWRGASTQDVSLQPDVHVETRCLDCIYMCVCVCFGVSSGLLPTKGGYWKTPPLRLPNQYLWLILEKPHSQFKS